MTMQHWIKRLGAAALLGFAQLSAAQIAGQVLDGEMPQPDISVSLYDASGQFVSSNLTEVDTGYSFSPPSGTYLLVVEDPAAKYVGQIYHPLGNIDCGFEFSCDGQGAAAAGGFFYHDSFATSPPSLDFSLNGGVVLTVDVDDGSAPLNNAGIRLVNSSGVADQLNMSDADDGFTDGTVVSPALPVGEYQVFAVAPAGVSLQPTLLGDVPCLPDCLRDPNATGASPLEVSSDRTVAISMQGGFKFAGTIADIGTEDPIPGVEVCIFLDDGSPTGLCSTSDAGGNYVTTGLADQKYFLLATPTSAAPGNYIAQLNGGVFAVPVDFGAGEPVVLEGGDQVEDFLLTEGSRIRGAVFTDTEDLLGAVVDIFNEEGVLTASAITYDVAEPSTENYASVGLPDGTYFVRFDGRHLGTGGYVPLLYASTSCPGLVCPVVNGTAVVISGVDQIDIDGSLNAGFRVRGTITASGTGAPIAGASVQIHNQFGGRELTVLSDDRGRYGAVIIADSTSHYLVAGAPSLNYLTAVYGASGEVNCPIDDLLCMQNASVTTFGDPYGAFPEQSLIRDMQLDPGYRISGAVREDDEATLINDVVDISVETSGGVLTNASAATTGFWQINKPLPAGDYKLQAVPRAPAEFQSEYYCLEAASICNQAAADTVSLSTVNQTGINFSLTPITYSISGTISDADTAVGLPGADVCALDSGGDPTGVCVTATTGGVYDLQIRAGSYQIEADEFNYASALHDGGTLVSVSESQTSQAGIDLALAPLSFNVTGTVTDTAGTPAAISGATVCLYDSGGLLTAYCDDSDTNGDYAIAMVPAGTYYAIAGAAEYRDRLFDGMVCNGCDATTGTALELNETNGDASAVDFALSPVVYSNAITGTISDATGVMTDMSGTTVCLYSGDGLSQIFCLAPSSSSTYGISVTAGTYQILAERGAFKDRFFMDGGTVTINNENPSAPNTDIVLDPVIITGAVTETDLSTEIAAVEMRLYDASGVDTGMTTTTMADGSYSIRPLEGGNHYLKATAAEFEDEVYDDLPCEAGCSPNSGTPIFVSDTDIPGIDFQLAASVYTIAGTVTDTLAEPLDGAQVCIFEGIAELGCTMTAADGSYTLPAVDAGDYSIAADAENYAQSMAMLSVDNSFDGSPQNFQLTALTFSIDGIVTDGEGGPGIDGATLCFVESGSLDAPDCSGLTSVGGAWGLPVLQAGSYDISASADEFELNTVTAEVSETLGDVTDVVIALEARTYVISGIVTDSASGAPLVGALVCINESGGVQAPDCVVTDGAGAYAATPVRAGSYDLNASLADYIDQDVSVAVDYLSGDRQQNIVLLRDEGGLTGRVTLAGDGSGISAIDVLAFDSGGQFVDLVTTDVAGHYSFTNLPTGDYYLAADGSIRGFISEVYAGRDGDDLVELSCDNDNDCSAVILDGLPVSVSTESTASNIDFELQAGDVLSPDNLQAFDQMGFAVALCGSRAAIGVPGDDELGEDAGKVLVYQREGTGYVLSHSLWPEVDETTLRPLDGERFGASLSCDGDLIVIGAPGDGIVAKSRGAKGTGPDKAAYIMQLSGGSAPNLAKLIASNLGMTDDSGWGQSVAIQGSTLAVGAPNATGDSGNNSGVVAMFDVDPQSFGSSAAPNALISDPNGGAGDSFGTSISVSQGNIAVGAPKQTPGNLGLGASGMAHIFQNLAGSGWGNNPVASITNAGGQAGDGFGTSVSLQGNMMAAGAPGDDTAGQDAGAAHVFTFSDGGNFTAVGAPIVPSISDPGANFGTSVSLSGTSLAIGAPSASVSGKPSKTGAGYLFGLAGGVWSQVAQALSNSGQTGDLFGAAVAYDGSGFVVGAPNGLRLGVPQGFVQVAVQNDTLFKSNFE